jgi:LmbE family N-acetylglucosaminyl deacetylase
VRRITLEMPNRYLADTVENRNRLAEVIREVRPEILFVPYWVDAHPDHVAGAALCEAARFYAKLTRTAIPGEPVYPRRVIHFLCTHYNLHVRTSFIMDVTPHLEAKLRAVRSYGSQFGPERRNEEFFEDLRDWNRYFGGLIRTGYGEPFVLREEVGLRGLDQFI